MIYSNDNGVTSYNLGQLKALFPNVSFSANTPAELGYFPYVAPVVVPQLTAAELKQRLIEAVSVHLDSKAKELGYDNIISACSYTGGPNIFQAESLALLSWRASVWSYCYQVLADVTNNVRSVPSPMELLGELPLYVAP